MECLAAQIRQWHKMKCFDRISHSTDVFIRGQSLLHNMLTNVSTRIICVLCDNQNTVQWVSDMVCRHISGVRKFFLIAIGSIKVTAAFCVICPDCLKGYSFGDKRQELDYVYTKAKETDIASRIRDITNLLAICTYGMAINRLKTIRPEIEVGRALSVHTRGWLG